MKNVNGKVIERTRRKNLERTEAMSEQPVTIYFTLCPGWSVNKEFYPHNVSFERPKFVFPGEKLKRKQIALIYEIRGAEMDTRTGVIYTPEEMDEITKDYAKVAAEKNQELMELIMPPGYKEMKLPPTDKQMARKPPRVGRNETCPCGSGKKFKHCCLDNSPPEEQR